MLKLLFIIFLLYLAARALRRIAHAVLEDPQGPTQGPLRDARRDRAPHDKDARAGQPPRWNEDVEDATFRDV